MILSAVKMVTGFAPVVRPNTVRPTKDTRLHIFGQNKPQQSTRSNKKSSPLLDDALEAYPYIFKSDEEKASASANFNEIARLYGDEEALAMVKIQPRVLKFKRDNFVPCLESWEEQFGLESAKAMVCRNPGLLGVRPEQTDNAEASMFFSYLVAATRPWPQIVGAGLVLAILSSGLQ